MDYVFVAYRWTDCESSQLRENGGMLLGGQRRRYFIASFFEKRTHSYS